MEGYFYVYNSFIIYVDLKNKKAIPPLPIYGKERGNFVECYD